MEKDDLISWARDNIFKKIYNCHDLTEFIKSITLILPYRGYSSSHFFINTIDSKKFKLDNKGPDTYQFLTKLNFYKKDYPELYGITNKDHLPQITAEYKALELLKKEFIDKKITPCIIKLLYYSECFDDNLNFSSNNSDSIEDNCSKMRETLFKSPSKSMNLIIQNLFCKNIELINSGLSNKGFSFMALEEGNITLKTYLKEFINNIEGIIIFKSLLFQVIITIYLISKKYPSFRHNDLHTDNIVLRFDKKYSFNPMKMKYLVFNDSLTEGGTTWTIPYFGIIAKIIDFGFVVIKEENIISNILDNKSIMADRPDNDILLLLYDIYSQIDDKEIDKIISKLDPTKFHRTFDIKFLLDHPNLIPSYKDLVYNNIWNEYKNVKVPVSSLYDPY